MQVTLRQFVKELKVGLSKAAGQKALQMSKGQCKDYAEYQKYVGVCAGLDGAGSLASDMLQQLEEATSEGDKLPEMPK